MPASAASTFSTVAACVLLVLAVQGSRSRIDSHGPVRARVGWSGEAGRVEPARQRWPRPLPVRAPADGVGQQPARVGPLEQAVGPVPGHHERVGPAGDGPDEGVVVGRGGPQADPGLEVRRLPQSPGATTRHSRRSSCSPAAVTVVEKPAPDFEGAAAGDPAHRATGPGSASGGAARWASRRSSSSTPRWTIWPLVGPTGSGQASHSPMAAVQAPPATATVSQETGPCPSTSTEVTRPSAARPDRVTAPATKVDAPCLGAGTDGGRHPLPVDPGPARGMAAPGGRDRAAGREPMPPRA